jgi:exodeoxyribonuclease VII large subunit
MENEIQQIYSVSDAIAVINQTLEYAYPTITVEGEVASFKINGGKWVFFDLKDDESSMRCFMPVWNLRTAIEDGMNVSVVAKPRLGKYGFSLNVDLVKPIGEGSIKKAFDLLRKRLEKEGLFAPERKRILPQMPSHIGVISSVEAAGYKDFVQILNQRLGGIKINVANVNVQGYSAPNQIIKALKYFNESQNPPEVIVILRGGGSRDDLVAFDDELLVRAIASSRVPILVGVGHEIDITLADLAADVRASTPSNAAEILVPDKREIIADIQASLRHSLTKVEHKISIMVDYVTDSKKHMKEVLQNEFGRIEQRFEKLSLILNQVNPKTVLRRGYAIVRDENGRILKTIPKVDDNLEIETFKSKILTTVVKITTK